MKFCGACGTQIEENQKFCPSCGMSTNGQEPVNSPYTQQGNAAQMPSLSEEKVMGILSYIGFLCLIPVFTARSPYGKFHANQGLVLFITEMIVYVIFRFLIWFMPWGMEIIALLAYYGCLGVCVYLVIKGIIAANRMEMSELPIIGGIQILK